jgi:histidyl-tRNA synthetase
MKGQLRHADRIGARAVVVVGDEIEVKDMATGEQTPVGSAREAVSAVEGLLA